ncbi:MAG: TldD/PmbA family protein, partial [Candidatus Cloacimonadota bacterium]|nr:TldD/PmbA family protein [Candidatus Cloacimonadota bacterium]
QKIFEISEADETEIFISKSKHALTRFANNYIHQNVDNESNSIRIRTIIGKKTASASTNSFTENALKKTLANAIDATKLQHENQKLLPLLPAQEYKPKDNFSEATKNFTAKKRAEMVSKAVTLCKKNKMEASGIFSNFLQEFAIANSNGLFAYDRSTETEFSITAIDGIASGWNEILRKDVNDVDVEKSAMIAIEKANLSKYPNKIDPGKYDVILEPAAVAEIIMFLLWKGFNGMDYMEGTSFLKANLNKKVFSDNFSIIDDPFDQEITCQPFDYEGSPIQKVILVEKGIPKNFVTNRWIAKQTGVENNCHAIPLPQQGAYPFAMSVKNGTSSLNKMIENSSKAILVTHFHYSNLIDPMELVITGMTRDGLFLVEDGKISKPLKNMRFTDSVLKIFSNIEEISQNREFAGGFFGGGFLVPAMKISNFNFSSSTEF